MTAQQGNLVGDQGRPGQVETTHDSEPARTPVWLACITDEVQGAQIEAIWDAEIIRKIPTGNSWVTVRTGVPATPEAATHLRTTCWPRRPRLVAGAAPRRHLPRCDHQIREIGIVLARDTDLMVGVEIKTSTMATRRAPAELRTLAKTRKEKPPLASRATAVGLSFRSVID